ncbi:MAG: hypothetical protein KatS3mg057_2081 [Herpetosiphonaceae bacterium]|nr:MAG: hypothetical protein KatS3mg057_2081 [Herpetosiphonaceae bacterium]
MSFGTAIVMYPDGRQESIVLNRPTIRLGRALENDLRIDHEAVADYHAQLFCGPTGFEIFDMTEDGGTFVDNIPLPSYFPQAIADDSVIQIGPIRIFLYPADEQPEGSAIRHERSQTPLTMEAVPGHPGTAQPAVQGAFGTAVIMSASGEQRMVALGQEKLLIGRASDNDIVIDDPALDEYHAVLAVTSRGFELSDLAGQQRILVDDIVEIGATRIFLFPGNSAADETPLQQPGVEAPPDDTGGIAEQEMRRVSAQSADHAAEEQAFPAPAEAPPAETHHRHNFGSAMLMYPDGRQALVPLIKPTIRIGRAGDNDIILDDSIVADYHAELFCSAEGYTITDLDSAVGTLIDNQQVESYFAQPVAADSVIQIGSVRILLYPDVHEASPLAEPLTSSTDQLSTMEQHLPPAPPDNALVPKIPERRRRGSLDDALAAISEPSAADEQRPAIAEAEPLQSEGGSSGTAPVETVPAPGAEEQAGQPEPRAAPRRSFGTAIVVYADDRQEPISLWKPTIRIGRASDNDIILDDPAVAEHHAQLFCDATGYQIFDLNSPDGTFIDSQRVPSYFPQPIAEDSVVQVGTVRIFLYPAEEDAHQKAGEQPEQREPEPKQERPAAKQSVPGRPLTQLTLSASDLVIDAGSTATITISFTSRSQVLDRIDLAVEGLPESWVKLTSQDLPIFPGSRGEVELMISPPRNSRSLAGSYSFKIVARSENRPNEQMVAPARLTINPFTELQAEISPRELVARWRGDYLLTLTNAGNYGQFFNLRGYDEKGALAFPFVERSVFVQPGETRAVPVRVRLKGFRLFGGRKSYPFVLSVIPQKDESAAQHIAGELNHRSLFRSGAPAPVPGPPPPAPSTVSPTASVSPQASAGTSSPHESGATTAAQPASGIAAASVATAVSSTAPAGSGPEAAAAAAPATLAARGAVAAAAAVTQPLTTPLHGPANEDLAHADLIPTSLTVEVGSAVTATISITNRASVVDRITFSVDGLPSSWVRITPDSLPLLPGAQSEAQLVIIPLRHFNSLAGPHPFRVIAHSERRPDERASVPGTLTVLPFSDFAVKLHPQQRSAKRKATYTFQIINKGNQTELFKLQGTDDQDALEFNFINSKKIKVKPGETRKGKLEVRARKWRWAGEGELYPFTLTVTPGEKAELAMQTIGRIYQQAVLPGWLVRPILGLGMVALALAVFAPLRNTVMSFFSQNTIKSVGSTVTGSGQLPGNLVPTGSGGAGGTGQAPDGQSGGEGQNSGSAQQPTAGAETPAAAGGGDPSGGGQPATGAETPAAGGEQPAGGGEAPATGAETPDAGGEQSAGGGGQSGAETPAAGGVTTPTVELSPTAILVPTVIPTATPIPPTPTPSRPAAIPIPGATRWTIADSPVVLSRDHVVPAGSTLTIDPGVEVRLASNVRLLVNGALFANGMPDAPVRFVSADGGRWSGIFVGSGGILQLIEADIHQAGDEGLAIFGDGGRLTIRDSLIADGGGGILTFNSNVELSGLLITGNELQGGPAIALALGQGNRASLIGNSVGGNRTPSGSVGAQILINGPLATLDIQRNLFVVHGGTNLLVDSNVPYSATIACNTFSSGAVGLALKTSVPSLDGFTVSIIHNAIEGNQNRGAAGDLAFDLRHNWWGDPGGPYEATRNPDGLGNSAGVNLNFAPWLTSRPDCAPYP